MYTSELPGFIDVPGNLDYALMLQRPGACHNGMIGMPMFQDITICSTKLWVVDDCIHGSHAECDLPHTRHPRKC